MQISQPAISQPAKPDGTENKTASTVNRSGGKVGLFRTEKPVGRHP
jgi:hypothetical protein